MELLQQLDDVQHGTDLMPGELGPERHRATRSLDRLSDRQRTDGRYLVVGEPPGHVHLTHGRLPLAGARDADDHFTRQAPDLVLGDADSGGAGWVEARKVAGFFQYGAGWDSRGRPACNVVVIR